MNYNASKKFYSICAPQTIIYAFLGEFHSAHHRSRVLIIGECLRCDKIVDKSIDLLSLQSTIK